MSRKDFIYEKVNFSSHQTFKSLINSKFNVQDSTCVVISADALKGKSEISYRKKGA